MSLERAINQYDGARTYRPRALLGQLEDVAVGARRDSSGCLGDLAHCIQCTQMARMARAIKGQLRGPIRRPRVDFSRSCRARHSSVEEACDSPVILVSAASVAVKIGTQADNPSQGALSVQKRSRDGRYRVMVMYAERRV